MIVALAGRRIDAPDTDPPRFPADRVDAVRTRIRDALHNAGATTLVSAAACGADLVAIEVAAALGLRRQIVLPGTPEVFRADSVVDDRPAAWGDVFDRVVADARAAGDLFLIDVPETGSEAYLRANAAILDRAEATARETSEPLIAFVVWNGPLTGRTDYTQDFQNAAAARGIPTRSIDIF